MSEAPHIDEIELGRGDHAERSDGTCAMEAVSWIAGEHHSYKPACVHSGIASAVVRVNDRVGSHGRMIIKGLLPHIVGTGRALPVGRFMCAIRVTRDAIRRLARERVSNFHLKRAREAVGVGDLHVAIALIGQAGSIVHLDNEARAQLFCDVMRPIADAMRDPDVAIPWQLLPRKQPITIELPKPKPAPTESVPKPQEVEA